MLDLGLIARPGVLEQQPSGATHPITPAPARRQREPGSLFLGLIPSGPSSPWPDQVIEAGDLSCEPCPLGDRTLGPASGKGQGGHPRSGPGPATREPLPEVGLSDRGSWRSIEWVSAAAGHRWVTSLWVTALMGPTPLPSSPFGRARKQDRPCARSWMSN